MEKKGILGPVDGRRPGDVTIPIWRSNKGVAIDVAVTSPFGYHNVSLSAETKKHKKYDEGFKGTCFEFVPMIFETTGGVNNEGLEMLRQLFRFASKPPAERLLRTRVGSPHAVCNFLFLNAFLIAQEV